MYGTGSSEIVHGCFRNRLVLESRSMDLGDGLDEEEITRA